MSPLNLIVQADTPENAARIERALRAGAPDCRIVFAHDRTAGGAPPDRAATDGIITIRAEPGRPTAGQLIDPGLRHEMNNHLALIRMLADYLVDGGNFAGADIARIREIASAAEAAAQALRRTKGNAA